MEKLDGGRPIVDQRREDQRRRVCALEMMGGSRSSFQNPTQKNKKRKLFKNKREEAKRERGEEVAKKEEEGKGGRDKEVGSDTIGVQARV